MIKKRKKIFIKIGCLLSAFIFAFTIVMLKPKAYTYNPADNIVYSDNALPFITPEKIVASNEYLFANFYSYNEQYYNFNYQNNYYYESVRISLYSNDSDNDYVDTLFSTSDISGLVNNIQVTLFNGKTLSYCIANYSNYRIRFMVRSSGNGLPYSYSYLQFNFGEMFSYLSQFKSLNTIFTNYVLTLEWTARPSTQDNRNFRFSNLGFYVGNNSSITNYNYYGLDGQYRNQWNDSLFEGYQTTIDNLQQENSALSKQVSQLNEQLNNTLGWKPLFFAMADTPFRTVKSMLGFEVLGVDLFGAFVGFLTILAIVWLIKKIIGR